MMNIKVALVLSWKLSGTILERVIFLGVSRTVAGFTTLATVIGIIIGKKILR
jgi:hypothetical protein